MNVISEIKSIHKELFGKVKGIHRLFIYAIFTISIDSFPWIPIETNNRPIFIFLLIIYWFSTKLILKEIYRFEIISLIILLVSWFYSVVCYTFIIETYAPLKKFLLTSTLSYITVCSSYFFIKTQSTRFSINEVISIIGRAYIISFILPFAVGTLQILGIHYIPLQAVADNVSNLFSSAQNNIFEANRIKLISNEPSQAGTYILYIFVYTKFMDMKKSFKFFLWATLIIFFVYINSSVVFLTIILVFVLNWILYEDKNLNSIFRTLFIGMFLLMLMYIIYTFFLSEYTTQRLIQLEGLIKDISLDNLILLSSVDFSVLDRFGTPIFGLYSLKFTNLIGTGGEGFYKVYEIVINTYFPLLTKNDYLAQQFIDQTGTVKFLPVKVITEFGILGIMIVLYFFVKYVRYLLNNKKNLFIKNVNFAFIFAVLTSYVPSYFNFNFILLVMIVFFAVSCHQMSDYKKSPKIT